MSVNPRTIEEQNRIAESLAQQYSIDRDRVFFPDLEDPTKPWLGADELILIARKSDQFQAIETRFVVVIAELNQVVHSARVVDKEGRIFERIGVATIGEKLPGSAKSDPHGLADTRAIVATLGSAGFNPLKSGSVAKESAKPYQKITLDSDAEGRRRDIRRIHALAEEVGYITRSESGTDDRHYRNFLKENYRVTSVAGMDATERASVINKLQIIKRELEDL